MSELSVRWLNRRKPEGDRWEGRKKHLPCNPVLHQRLLRQSVVCAAVNSVGQWIVTPYLLSWRGIMILLWPMMQSRPEPQSWGWVYGGLESLTESDLKKPENISTRHVIVICQDIRSFILFSFILNVDLLKPNSLSVHWVIVCWWRWWSHLCTTSLTV